MCGAVSFEISEVDPKFGVCHCEMCRRWTGSALLGVTVPNEKIIWQGVEHIAEYQSTSWAKRGWCTKCGTGLFFMVTLEGKYSGETEVPIGLFDDPNGFEMVSEIYIDHKPDSFAYAGEGRKVMTRQECVDKFGMLDSDGSGGGE